jgi:hypothetical protein
MKMLCSRLKDRSYPRFRRLMFQKKRSIRVKLRLDLHPPRKRTRENLTKYRAE